LRFPAGEKRPKTVWKEDVLPPGELILKNGENERLRTNKKNILK